MAIAYHTHTFLVPTASNDEAATGLADNKVLVPANLPPLFAAKQDVSDALTSIAGLTTAANQILVTNDVDSYSTATVTTTGLDLIGISTTALIRAYLDLEPNVDIQAYDAGLQSIANLTTSTDQFLYTTGSDTYATATLRSFAYEDRSDAESANVPASVETLYLTHRGEVLAYARKVGGTALTTGDGAEWTPAGRATINHYGPVADGVTDDEPVFDAAVADIPSGEAREIYVQAGVYKAVAVSNNGRSPVWVMDPEATFTDGFSAALAVNPSRREYWSGRQKIKAINGSTASFSTVGDYEAITNTGGEGGSGYGRRLSYRSNTFVGSGGPSFDIAEGRIGIWDRVAGQTGGQALTDWVVTISPTTAGDSPGWGAFCVEYDIVNRAGAYTQAYSGRAAAATAHGHFTGGGQVICEATTFTEPGDTYDALFGLVWAPSGANKSSDGKRARFWSGILGEANSIVGEGYAIQWSGNSDAGTPADDPDAFLKLNDRWETAFDLSTATLVESIMRLPAAKTFQYTATEYFGQLVAGEIGMWATGGKFTIDTTNRAIIEATSTVILNSTGGNIDGRANLSFSGSRAPSLVLPGYSNASIASAANAINTTSKAAGKLIRNTTNNHVLMATGATTTSTWVDQVDGTVITPA